MTAHEDDAPVLPGASVDVGDRYRLGALLGAGGMADVHQCFDRVLGREVAVKMLRTTAASSSDRDRFVAEARTLASMSHRGLVTLFDAGTDNDRPYLVMELVDGDTLAAQIQTGPMPRNLVADLGAQVARALAYAHDHGVVHRDVKPGNILIDEHDQAKLADFGIARLLGDTMRHTLTGTTIGTAAYLAPEQARGLGPTTAVDVYALGLVLLEALTGHREYDGPPAEAALARLRRAPVVPDDLGPGWAALLRAMTATDVASRPDAGAVASILEEMADKATFTAQAADRTRVIPAHQLPPPAPAPTWTTSGPRGLRPTAPPTEPRGRSERRPRAIDTAGWRERLNDGGAVVWVLAALALVLVLLMVVAALAKNAAGSDAPRRPTPPDAPPSIEQPLQSLHDAMES